MRTIREMAQAKLNDIDLRATIMLMNEGLSHMELGMHEIGKSFIEYARDKLKQVCEANSAVNQKEPA